MYYRTNRWIAKWGFSTSHWLVLLERELTNCLVKDLIFVCLKYLSMTTLEKRSASWILKAFPVGSQDTIWVVSNFSDSSKSFRSLAGKGSFKLVIRSKSWFGWEDWCSNSVCWVMLSLPSQCPISKFPGLCASLVFQNNPDSLTTEPWKWRGVRCSPY